MRCLHERNIKKQTTTSAIHRPVSSLSVTSQGEWRRWEGGGGRSKTSAWCIPHITKLRHLNSSFVFSYAINLERRVTISR